jgi:hypothetical protein
VNTGNRGNDCFCFWWYRATLAGGSAPEHQIFYRKSAAVAEAADFAADVVFILVFSGDKNNLCCPIRPK